MSLRQFHDRLELCVVNMSRDESIAKMMDSYNQLAELAAEWEIKFRSPPVGETDRVGICLIKACLFFRAAMLLNTDMQWKAGFLTVDDALNLIKLQLR